MVYNKIFAIDFPILDYEKALNLQRKIVSAKKSGSFKENIAIFLEHPPVFTLGFRGGLENLMVSEDFLKKSKISLVHAERGGNITFHGPGQLVVYPIIDLKKAGLGVKDYVSRLEKAMINTLKEWKVNASSDPERIGVWMENKKIGSIGVAIKRGISFHGLALNINVGLEPFSWINPCGLKGITITSVKKELGREVSMKNIRFAMKKHLAKALNMEIEACDNSIIKKAGVNIDELCA